jgi:phosphoglucomutase
MIDRVAAKLGRKLVEVPVGFKWFSEGLIDGSLGFGGEESAGASFLRRDGSVWTTDKDGLIMGLLAAEITAKTRQRSEQVLRVRHAGFGKIVLSANRRARHRANRRNFSAALDPAKFDAKELAGEPIERKLVNAPGNNAPIGGIKVVAKSGWFAARPSGTEDVYKIYAESFRSEDHLHEIQKDAQAGVDRVFGTQ